MFPGVNRCLVPRRSWKESSETVREELDRRGINLGRDQGLGPGVAVDPDPDPDSETGRRGYDSYMARDPDGWVLQIST